MRSFYQTNELPPAAAATLLVLAALVLLLSWTLAPSYEGRLFPPNPFEDEPSVADMPARSDDDGGESGGDGRSAEQGKDRAVGAWAGLPGKECQGHESYLEVLPSTKAAPSTVDGGGELCFSGIVEVASIPPVSPAADDTPSDTAAPSTTDDGGELSLSGVVEIASFPPLSPAGEDTLADTVAQLHAQLAESEQAGAEAEARSADAQAELDGLKAEEKARETRMQEREKSVRHRWCEALEKIAGVEFLERQVKKAREDEEAAVRKMREAEKMAREAYEDMELADTRIKEGDATIARQQAEFGSLEAECEKAWKTVYGLEDEVKRLQDTLASTQKTIDDDRAQAKTELEQVQQQAQAGVKQAEKRADAVKEERKKSTSSRQRIKLEKELAACKKSGEAMDKSAQALRQQLADKQSVEQKRGADDKAEIERLKRENEEFRQSLRAAGQEAAPHVAAPLPPSPPLSLPPQKEPEQPDTTYPDITEDSAASKTNEPEQAAVQNDSTAPSPKEPAQPSTIAYESTSQQTASEIGEATAPIAGNSAASSAPTPQTRKSSWRDSALESLISAGVFDFVGASKKPEVAVQTTKAKVKGMPTGPPPASFSPPISPFGAPAAQSGPSTALAGSASASSGPPTENHGQQDEPANNMEWEAVQGDAQKPTLPSAPMGSAAENNEPMEDVPSDETIMDITEEPAQPTLVAQRAGSPSDMAVEGTHLRPPLPQHTGSDSRGQQQLPSFSVAALIADLPDIGTFLPPPLPQRTGPDSRGQQQLPPFSSLASTIANLPDHGRPTLPDPSSRSVFPIGTTTPPQAQDLGGLPPSPAALGSIFEVDEPMEDVPGGEPDADAIAKPALPTAPSDPTAEGDEPMGGTTSNEPDADATDRSAPPTAPAGPAAAEAQQGKPTEGSDMETTSDAAATSARPFAGIFDLRQHMSGRATGARHDPNVLSNLVTQNQGPSIGPASSTQAKPDPSAIKKPAEPPTTPSAPPTQAQGPRDEPASITQPGAEQPTGPRMAPSGALLEDCPKCKFAYKVIGARCPRNGCGGPGYVRMDFMNPNPDGSMNPESGVKKPNKPSGPPPLPRVGGAPALPNMGGGSALPRTGGGSALPKKSG